MATPTITPKTSTSSVELTGSAKLQEVTRLMNELKEDLQEIKLLPHQRDAFLEQVKVYGRDPTNADPIFTKEGIETLTRHAFNSPSLTTSRNALRCLANAMLLKPETRQMLVDLGYMSKACGKLKNDSRDDEFLVSRIIFLTTYGTTIDIAKLIDEDQLAEYICQNIGRQAKIIVKPKKPADPMQDMALVESLKLLFNLTHFCPQRKAAFSPALQHILVLISKVPISSSKPMDPPVAQLVNALINLDLKHKDNVSTLFPKATPNTFLDCFVDILEKSTKVYPDSEIEQLVSPLLTLLRVMYEVAPKEVKTQMRKVILPSNTDRDQPLGRAETLPSRLLHLSTNPIIPQTRESASSLLFELSDKDASKFVQNVGYGFASGFLFSHNIPLPANALEAGSTSSNERASQDGQNLEGKINPITGQFLDKEEKVEIDMTDEEKEREAERLFVLFERLKKTGIVDIQNPVAQAFQEGRFEELPDDAESD
ncbi:hypothetical protein HYFRA_00010865 [Hymenoscyphus fraxineus]|uniref:Guanine nucleotide exchange factor synembryn n=1 Tax=Hymenoscyphus fraxineus TaxID=746836 RepID=A0A9N9KUV3_9HELO|nr:hypothetical protein HYFRA_00010865 [Hymenoscyphus fraxineus]